MKNASKFASLVALGLASLGLVGCGGTPGEPCKTPQTLTLAPGYYEEVNVPGIYNEDGECVPTAANAKPGSYPGSGIPSGGTSSGGTSGGTVDANTATGEGGYATGMAYFTTDGSWANVPISPEQVNDGFLSKWVFYPRDADLFAFTSGSYIIINSTIPYEMYSYGSITGGDADWDVDVQLNGLDCFTCVMAINDQACGLAKGECKFVKEGGGVNEFYQGYDGEHVLYVLRPFASGGQFLIASNAPVHTVPSQFPLGKKLRGKMPSKSFVRNAGGKFSEMTSRYGIAPTE